MIRDLDLLLEEINKIEPVYMDEMDVESDGHCEWVDVKVIKDIIHQLKKGNQND